MKEVKIGVIGLGNMGSSHAQQVYDGMIPGGVLTALYDQSEEKRRWAEARFSGIKICHTLEEFLNVPRMDGIMIATPHFDHPSIAIRAFEKNLHVLCEKPAGVYTKTVRQMNEAAEKSGRKFSMMFNQRTNPLYQKLKDLVKTGELGAIKRTNWIITDWYRSQSYYDSADWRATWAGEGGGVMMNQSPHQLDLWQWTTELMPVKIRAFCSYGKYHDIEVEDDVTVYVEYENGATGLFVTSTGEAPGTNRFEVVGNMGKVVIENNQLTFWRLRQSERDFNREYTGGFGTPECWKIDIPVEGANEQHVGIMKNWVDAILNDTELLAPGIEGINSLLIANAVYLSSWTDSWVDIPFDEDLYYEKLAERIEGKKGRRSLGK